MTIKIEQIKTAALTPYARNSRTHSEEQVAQVAASIREFGFTNPVLIDADGVIVAGHGRVMAAKSLGMEKVPCIRLGHLNEAQIRAYVIADNKLAENAGWDEDMLRLEIQHLQSVDFDLSLMGFSDDDLASLLADDEPPTEGLTEADQVPEAQRVVISRPGDIWTLGKHRLMCGDSTSVEQVHALMGGGMADLLLTDPPYNVAYEGGTEEALTIKNDSMSDGDFRKFLQNAYRAANAVMRTGAVFYVWHADVEGYNFRGAAKDVGWTVRQCLIWAKNSFVLGRKDYHWKHESCLYGWKDGAAHYWGSDRSQTTLLEFNRPTRNGEHPAMKPVDLFRYQVENSSRKNETVLDLFGGSGTTLIACEQASRQARLMELDPKYCDVIIRRWQEFTGKAAVREADGATFDSLCHEEVPA